MKRKQIKSAGPPTGSFRNILVPVDFCDLSLRALGYAVNLIQNAQGVLTLVHVVPSDYGLLGIGREDSRELERSLQKQAADRLRMLADRNIPRSIRVNIEVRLGRPGEEIVAAAKEHDSEVIVLSTHGRTGLDRYLIGSVADRVTRLAPCPVFLIPPPRSSTVRKPGGPAVLRAKREVKRRG